MSTTPSRSSARQREVRRSSIRPSSTSRSPVSCRICRSPRSPLRNHLSWQTSFVIMEWTYRTATSRHRRRRTLSLRSSASPTTMSRCSMRRSRPGVMIRKSWRRPMPRCTTMRPSLMSTQGNIVRQPGTSRGVVMWRTSSTTSWMPSPGIWSSSWM